MKVNFVILIAALAIAVILVSRHGLAAEPAKPRPNILWLTIEDTSPWIPCYGDKTVPTPALSKMADESLRFTRAFATSPVCAAARSSLITGMYATRIGSMDHRNGNFRFPDSDAENARDGYEAVPPAFVRCFPEHLRAAGYYCTNNSKQDYQFRAPETAWDESSRQAHWKNRPEGAPFFAVFNYVGTHESQAFPDAKQRPQVVKPEDVPLPPYYPDTPQVRDAVARTYNNIAAMDKWVSERLKEVEDAGLLDNTIVFFFSDHGVGLPRGKRSPYDSGTQVPFMVRFPDGSRAGETSDRVISFVDVGPTVLSLAGVKPDERLDGVPFLGEFEKPGTGYAFANADRFDGTYDRARSVTDGHYRYVRNYDVHMPYMIHNNYREALPMMADLYALAESGKGTPEQWQMTAKERHPEELYDSQKDPWEVHDIADDPALASKKQELSQRLDQWIAATGDLGLVLPEAKMVHERLWHGATQPVTATPECAIKDGHVSISCATEGASIGYRAKKSEPWQVYREPFETPKGRKLQVVAHRIGWKPAEATVDLKTE